MISLQTNVDSLVAQANLSTNSKFQSKTIQQLTSGYRINSSADDAAGLAIANGYRNNISELTQGVSNANDGISQLQIIDGGLSNISTILDRMKTLATQSASGTFTGDRNTLNSEYQGLVSEITRQATNVNLNAGGSFNSNLSVYIGGASNSSNASVNINLGGSSNAVDATSLKLSSTSIVGGGTSFTNASSSSLNDPNARFLTAGSEAFTLTYVDSKGVAQTSSALTINSQSGGYTGTQFVQALNQAITNAGISGVSAQIGGNGSLQLSGTNLLSASVTNTGVTAGVTTGASDSLTNSANYQTSAGNFTAFADGTSATTHQSQSLSITAGGQQYNVSLNSDSTDTSHYADTLSHAITSLNKQLQGSGVYAVADSTNSKIVFESNSSFTVSQASFSAGDGTGAAGSVFGGSASTVGTNQAVTAPTQDTTATGNAVSAISSIDSAIKSLGLAQGAVGAGQNKLQYAIMLAQSQISNFSAAQSQIRDADVASDAANLTKSQVLVQTSIAAMAQANSEPQSVMKLLQG
jgi:flagellin